MGPPLNGSLVTELIIVVDLLLPLLLLQEEGRGEATLVQYLG
jgi:hypothetical protein